MKKFVFTFLLCISFVLVYSAPVKFIQRSEITSILFDKAEKEVVHTALDILSSDMENVSERKPVIVELSDKKNIPTVIVGTLGQSKHIDRLIKDKLLTTENLNGQWEAFQIQVVKQKKSSFLVVVGSDSRGTAYGILELSRMMGVSPWKWWADVIPVKKDEIEIPEDYFDFQKPSVQYRGIFLNDEDWGLMPWSSKTFEPSTEKGRIGPKTYGRIFELLLRLRANTLWPAMHECTIPFYFVPGNKEMANKYGIVLGTSHCEPLMRNSAGEWDKNKYGEYNYLTNSQTVQNYWSERLKEAGEYENFYTIGMRGVHDGKMEGVKTLDEQTAVLSKVLEDQRKLLEKHVSKDVTKIPQAFIPYKEVLEIYDNNLSLPDDVTLVWCDDNYGYITRLSNEAEQKRSGGSGVYYHISYWGRPHDHLWLSTAQPALIYWQMKNAWDNNARKLWILNVGDIKPAEHEIEFLMNMAWNVESFTPQGSIDHMKSLYSRDIGEEFAEDIFSIMNEYYRLASIRKPEFMGWSRVEEYGAIKGGKTPVIDTEFNPYAFGDEIYNRLKDYQKIANKVGEIKSKLSDDRKDAFFQLVEYPVLASAEMNKKLLYAQKARLYASYGLPVFSEYDQKSVEAYNTIVNLTKKYNEDIQSGKWNLFMNMKPRNLAVFEKIEYKESVQLVNGDHSLIWFENHNKPSSRSEKINMPAFVKGGRVNYFASVLQQGVSSLGWSVENKPEWLIIREIQLGLKSEKRIEFSVDWDNVKADNVKADMLFVLGKDSYSIQLEAIIPQSKGHTESDRMIAMNGSDYTQSGSNGKVVFVKGLGYSESAIEMSEGEKNALEYDIYTSSTGDAIIKIAMIPNHPVDNDIRYAVSVDGEEPSIVSMKTKFRSEPWKINVLRNQDVKILPVKIKNPGKHTIKIYALDRGIVLDQLMLDFDVDRKFYQIPVSN